MDVANRIAMIREGGPGPKQPGNENDGEHEHESEEGELDEDEEARIDEALEESFPASDPPYWTRGMPTLGRPAGSEGALHR